MQLEGLREIEAIDWDEGPLPGGRPTWVEVQVVIMVGAVITTVATMDASLAILPLLVGILAAAVACGRTRVAPLTDRRANRAALHLAI